jgi:signal peptide peptidase SppA
VSLATIGQTLEQAFKIRSAKAIVLMVNSPGGSPVQSTLIHNRIRQLAEKHEKPVYVFAEDVAASGGYMLACAGDELYADTSSIIGSIGVISAGFGFAEVIKKLGIERRVHTAGTRKMMLDAFSKENPDDVKRLKELQKQIHDAFIKLVKSRRGDKLKAADSKLFTGEFWAGGKALELGLIDGLGDMHTIMREKLGDDVRFKVLGQERGWLRRRLSGAQGRMPNLAGLMSLPQMSLADDVISAIETRTLWQRFGF